MSEVQIVWSSSSVGRALYACNVWGAAEWGAGGGSWPRELRRSRNGPCRRRHSGRRTCGGRRLDVLVLGAVVVPLERTPRVVTGSRSRGGRCCLGWQRRGGWGRLGGDAGARLGAREHRILRRQVQLLNVYSREWHAFTSYRKSSTSSSLQFVWKRTQAEREQRERAVQCSPRRAESASAGTWGRALGTWQQSARAARASWADRAWRTWRHLRHKEKSKTLPLCRYKQTG